MGFSTKSGKNGIDNEYVLIYNNRVKVSAFVKIKFTQGRRLNMILSDFTSHDGRKIKLYVWDEVQNPKAVVKIAHGMVEHSARYDDFARYLNGKGYIVVMKDRKSVV